MNNSRSVNIASTVEAISKFLNQPEKWTVELGEILQDIEWSEIEPREIIPTSALRKFTKSIANKEVRHDLMHFLDVYAENYFIDGAEKLVVEDARKRGVGVMSDVRRAEAGVYIARFKAELKAQMQQLKTTEDFSGERFKKQEKRIKELEDQLKELTEQNKQLSTQVDRWEHPARYGHYIPDELSTDEFRAIMNYLCDRQLAVGMRDNTGYGVFIQCYHWHGSKALFGYFVDKLSYELDLRDSGGRIHWKLFKPAIHNYDELIKEARNTVSEYTNNPKIRKPEKAEIIEEAIKNANKKEENTSAKTRQVIINRI